MPPLPTPLVAFTGAGLGTASGIPDFRSPGGAWDRHDPMRFTIDRFYEDPDTFWERRAALIAAMDYLDAEPNVAHTALADACRKGLVSHIITQNVDGLHSKAGTPPDRLLELHGNGAWAVCVSCGDREDVRATLARRTAGRAPPCQGCGGLLKPDVVLFGEPVPAMGQALAAVEGAQTLLVAGTSLTVHPAAGLVEHAARCGVKILLLNREPTPYDHLAVARDPRPLVESVPAALQRLKPSLQ